MQPSPIIPNLTPAQIRATLPGNWLLTRTISGVGELSGQAIFTESGDYLIYRKEPCLKADALL